MRYVDLILDSFELFLSLSIDDKILCISIIFLIITSLKATLILPIVFNFKIIPRIEYKIGRQLQYDSFYNSVYLFGNYFARYAEIAFYICFTYFRLPFKRNEAFALVKVNYQLEEFSEKEIFWSTYAMINFLIFGINMIIAFNLL